MSFLAWIVLGLVSGFLGSKIVNNRGAGVFVDIIVGMLGAVVGGFLFNFVGAPGVTGLNLWSILVAVAGSVALLVPFYALQRRRTA